jgi:SNF2 family DNA or RNA helicase
VQLGLVCMNNFLLDAYFNSGRYTFIPYYSFLFRWTKLIQRPYENGDERGLNLVKAILRPLMLRRTKETKDKEGRLALQTNTFYFQVGTFKSQNFCFYSLI